MGWTIESVAGAPVLATATAAPAAPPIAGGSQPVESQQPLGSQGGAPQGPGPNPFGTLLLPLILVFGLMILMQVFAGRKQKKQRAEMLSSLSRHDRIQTVGGLIGTVAEVKDGEIVLKIDESTNTKVRVARAAVQTVLKKASGAGSGRGASSDAIDEPEPVSA